MSDPITQPSGRYPVLPLRDMVVFPFMVVHLFVGRQKSLNALRAASMEHNVIVLATQKNPDKENASTDDLYTIGVLAEILQTNHLNDGTIRLLIRGLTRVNIESFQEMDGYLEASYNVLSDTYMENPSILDVTKSVLDLLTDLNKQTKKIPADTLSSLRLLDSPVRIADSVAAHLPVGMKEKQKILSIIDVAERLFYLKALLEAEMSVLSLEKKIHSKVKKQMEKNQRDYYLNEQMKAIQAEMGDSDSPDKEYDELKTKIERLKLSAEAKEKASQELKKLKSMSPMSAEASVIRNYLDWLLNLPWGKLKKNPMHLDRALEILNRDHYALGKIKDRILEYLAVQKRTGTVHSSILCLVGPPGVGKTSLGRSIANAAGRDFVRISLGGVRDEAEIRGHRRTYIGAMPGKIIQNMKKVGTANPLILLDEIDKMSSDFRGDPSSALLEVLDPEQNASFVDHYLEVPYDLSRVLFVTTANSYDIPAPLLDRMEILELSGYTEEEKLQIAKHYLLKKQYEEKKLKAKEFIVDDDVILALIRSYTRESGVRNLNRALDNLARKTVRQLEDSSITSVHITTDTLSDFAGPAKYRTGDVFQSPTIGLVTGLAWTRVGGEILSIEAVRMPGKGRFLYTGKLGDVMKESIQTAKSFIQSQSLRYGIPDKVFHETDVHVHVPEGATPKDGPSAGIAMATSIVSLLTGIPVKNDVAMTGEITLMGRVLPIGGLKEKLLAALRSGIKTVLIPKDNEKDLQDMPQTLLDSLSIISVTHIDDVFAHALVSSFVSLETIPLSNVVHKKRSGSKTPLIVS